MINRSSLTDEMDVNFYIYAIVLMVYEREMFYDYLGKLKVIVHTLRVEMGKSSWFYGLFGIFYFILFRFICGEALANSK